MGGEGEFLQLGKEQKNIFSKCCGSKSTFELSKKGLPARGVHGGWKKKGGRVGRKNVMSQQIRRRVFLYGFAMTCYSTSGGGGGWLEGVGPGAGCWGGPVAADGWSGGGDGAASGAEKAAHTGRGW